MKTHTFLQSQTSETAKDGLKTKFIVFFWWFSYNVCTHITVCSVFTPLHCSPVSAGWSLPLGTPFRTTRLLTRPWPALSCWPPALTQISCTNWWVAAQTPHTRNLSARKMNEPDIETQVTKILLLTSTFSHRGHATDILDSSLNQSHV